MNQEGNFLIYCVEHYKFQKKLTGIQVCRLFDQYHVWEYIYSCFEALHTTGENYIVADIDAFIQARE